MYHHCRLVHWPLIIQRCPFILIKDTLNKGHLCIKDTFQCTNLYLKEDNLSIIDKMICPNVSVI